MKKVLYFAYGSNMSTAQINWRLNNPKNVGTHVLKGWKLAFNAESPFGCHNFANIVKGSPDDFVEGVLYDITHAEFKTLDCYEGLYERYYFDIDADTLGCVYICTDKKNIDTYYNPEEYYIDKCITGAKENNLTHTANYLTALKNRINFTTHRRSKSFKDF